MNIQSLFEYGSRAGFWRLHRAFTARSISVTVHGVAMARNPQAVAGMLDNGWEIATHGYRWIDYQYVPEITEREHLAAAIDIHTKVTGSRPLGWYLGRCSPNTHRLIAEEGGFIYNADSCADDLPYSDTSHGKPQPIVPYTLDANDMRFATAQGFNSGDQFFAYLKDTFDVLYREGETQPRMMSVGAPLPARRPARPHRRGRALPRLRLRPRAGVDRAPHRHRLALDRHPPFRALTGGAWRLSRAASSARMRQPRCRALRSSATSPGERRFRQQYACFPEIGGNVKPQLASARCEFGASEERQVGMLEHAAQRSREFGAGSSD
jgi:peptidoglycan/xylan/chitin deacetylase (PgdA/CDA1 family)